jgi:hypothetical protein
MSTVNSFSICPMCGATSENYADIATGFWDVFCQQCDYYDSQIVQEIVWCLLEDMGIPPMLSLRPDFGLAFSAAQKIADGANESGEPVA